MRKYYSNDKTLTEFLENIENDVLDHDFLFVIAGKTGPTGKSHVASCLRRHGYRAVEITENLLGLVTYKDDENHFILGLNHVFIIVLNKPLGKIDDILAK